ncbi:Cna B-type domain-containing protein [Periweissella cryptocerci]|uniref:Cna B-type domain-containing protein n=1 Tax=Periweissella cryptocerci TaxID=2506420 RepID=A0A4P6YUG4_9LACO|nr:Cna B-type domain-containing protein [Periweissella cryptocerci]QBO36361.1 Cna B-type domain-containing protein [Periweissella cryptocerci]
MFKIKIKHINILMVLLMVTGIILATVVPTIESISNARSMKVQVNSKDEKPLIDGENYSFTSQTKRHDHKVDWTFKFTKNKSTDPEQFSLVLNENQTDFDNFDDFSVNGNDLAIPDVKEAVEKLVADEKEDIEELEQDDDEAREATQHGTLTWQETADEDDTKQNDDKATKQTNDEPKYQLVYTTAEPTKQAEEIEITFSTRINDEVYAANTEVKLEVQPHLIAGMTEKLPLGDEDDKKLAKNAKSYELTVDAKVLSEAPDGIKEAQDVVETFQNDKTRTESDAEVTDTPEPKQAVAEKTSDAENTKNASAKPSTRSQITSTDPGYSVATFDPSKYQFTTSGGTGAAGTNLKPTNNTWENEPVSRIQITRDAQSTDWRTYTAWANTTTNVGNTYANSNSTTAPGNGTNLQIYQKDDSFGFNGQAPNQNLRRYANGEFFGDPQTAANARTDATRLGYLFEFNFGAAGNYAAPANPAWTNSLKLYVQYSNAGKYYTPEHPAGLQMGALLTFSEFKFGNNGTGNRTTGMADHPILDVSNSLMGGFMMDGIRDIRVQIQYFSVKENGDFDKLLDIQPITTSNPALQSWLSIGPLVNHSAGTAGDYRGSEAVSKTSDIGNHSLLIEPSIGSLMTKIPTNAGNNMNAYADMYTSTTTRWEDKLGMVNFEKQAISFQVVGTTNEFRFKNGNGYFLKSFSSSFVRPVSPKQPTKQVTASETNLNADELNAANPANKSTIRLNDGETTTTTTANYTYNDNTNRTLNSGTNNTWYGLTTAYPSGMNVRRQRTGNTTATFGTYTGGTAQTPTGAANLTAQSEGFGAIVWNRNNGTLKNAGNALIVAGTGNNTAPTYVDTRQRQLTIDGDWALYPDGTYVRRVGGKIYQGKLRANNFSTQALLQANMPGYAGAVVAPYLTGTLPVGLEQLEVQVLPSGTGTSFSRYTAGTETTTINTTKLYDATKNPATGEYRNNQVAKVHYYDISQPTYHIPNESVTKPGEITIKDTLPVGIKPNFPGTQEPDYDNALGAIPWNFSNNNTTSVSLWNTTGAQLTLNNNSGRVKIQKITNEDGQLQYAIEWTFTAATINALTFDGEKFVVRIPVIVNTASEDIKKITDENPYPAFEIYNQAQTYFKTESPQNEGLAFNWNGLTNTVKTQIRFTDFADNERFIRLGLKKIWNDPSNADAAQMAASGMQIVQNANTAQPDYVEYRIYRKIGTQPETFFRAERIEKPNPGIYQWPTRIIEGLTNMERIGTTIQPVTYSVEEVVPEHYRLDKQVHYARDTEPTRPELTVSVDGHDRELDEYFEFTNRPIVQVSGRKAWNENGKTGITHSGLKVYLIQDDAVLMDTTVQATPTTNWNYSFNNRDRFGFDTNNNKWFEHRYSVTEDDMENYIKLDDTRAIDVENGDVTHNMTNTNQFVPDWMPVDGQKSWSDTGNIANKRPSKLILKLYRAKFNGTPTLVSTYVTDANGGDGTGGLGAWEFDFGSNNAIWNLPTDQLDYARRYGYFAKDYLDEDGNRKKYTYSVREFTYDDAGKEIDSVPGYKNSLTEMRLAPLPNYVDPVTGKAPAETAHGYEFSLVNTIDTFTALTNRKTVWLNVVSASDTTQALAGVRFAVYQFDTSVNAWTFYKESVTNANGDVRFDNLDAGLNNPAGTGAARDRGVKYRLVPISAPIGYEVPKYELEFELVYNMAVATASVGGSSRPAIPEKKYTVLQNASMKLYTPTGTGASQQSGVASGQAFTNTSQTLTNTATTNTANFGNIQSAVTLDRDYNIGNSHNVGNPAVTGTGAIYGAPSYQFGTNNTTFYNGTIGVGANGTDPRTRQELAITIPGVAIHSNNIDREIRLVIKLDRRQTPFPTTGGVGLVIFIVGALGMLSIYAWRVWREKSTELRGGADE